MGKTKKNHEKTTQKYFTRTPQKRKENILLLSKWTDEDIEETSKRYRAAKKIAEEENNFEFYKILEEKLSQLYATQDLKFSYTEEASDWIHW